MTHGAWKDSWKITVVADLDTKPSQHLRVEHARPEAWLDELRPTVLLRTPKGERALSFNQAGDFLPRALRSVLFEGTAAPPSGRECPELDQALHAAAFQRLDSLRHGLSFLLAQASESLEIDLLAVSRGDLVRSVREMVVEPARRDPGTAPSLLLLDIDFSHQPADLADLRALAELASEIYAPLVAGASPALFGLRHFAHVANFPDPMAPLTDAAHLPWRAFHTSDLARWVCLTLGRFLQRAPYDIPDPPYLEKVEEGKPETFLWGRGVWLVGAAVARSLRQNGHPLDLAGRGALFAEMPVRAYPKSLNESVPLSAEAPLPDMRASELAWAGVTPVVGALRSGTLVLPMVVTAFRLQPGRLTLEGTLAYQLAAARLASCLQWVLDEGPLSEAEVETRLRPAILQALGPLAGDKPEDAVRLETIPGAARPEGAERSGDAARRVSILVCPAVTLEGKKPEFRFELPLRG